ncbi:unnamed protein product [Phyllotreta striolata]|uniref:Uncharacterized protein n=1 Tax=Phyllotreta striolata TaxID=444603 RepID=A0A9N9TB42_PHYSR|nr:unnamed protein product [Phyllotreta striolata]
MVIIKFSVLLIFTIFTTTLSLYISEENEDDSNHLGAISSFMLRKENVSFMVKVFGDKRSWLGYGIAIGSRQVLISSDILNEYLIKSATITVKIDYQHYKVENFLKSDILFNEEQLTILELEQEMPETVEIIPLISEEELEEAITDKIEATIIGFSNIHEPSTPKVTLLPGEECINDYILYFDTPSILDIFNSTQHFCFFPMKEVLLTQLYGSTLIINEKLAGIKLRNQHPYNTLYSKITSFSRFFNSTAPDDTTTKKSSTSQNTVTEESTTTPEVTKTEDTTREKITTPENTETEESTTTPDVTTTEDTTTDKITSPENTITQDSTTTPEVTTTEDTMTEKITTPENTETEESTTTPEVTTTEDTVTEKITTPENTETEESTTTPEVTTTEDTTTEKITTPENTITQDSTTIPEVTTTEDTVTEKIITPENPETEESTTTSEVTTTEDTTTEKSSTPENTVTEESTFESSKYEISTETEYTKSAKNMTCETSGGTKSESMSTKVTTPLTPIESKEMFEENTTLEPTDTKNSTNGSKFERPLTVIRLIVRVLQNIRKYLQGKLITLCSSIFLRIINFFKFLIKVLTSMF